MEDSKSLTLRDGSKLGWLEKNYKFYLNKMTLLFGASGSGKSTIMDEIMWLLRPHVPVCFVVAPTNSSNQAYTGKVPRRFIKDGRDLKKLVAWLERFVSRQKNTAQMYAIANDLKNLKPLFDMISDDRAKEAERLIIRKAEDSMIFVDTADALNFAQKKTQKAEIKTQRTLMLRNLYKTAIRHHKTTLERMSDLKKKRAGGP